MNPTNAAVEPATREVQAAARRVGQELVVVGASSADEIDTVFATLARQRVGGILLNGDTFFAIQRDQIVALAARHVIPTLYSTREFTEAGGLMSYTDDRFESWRQAGNYIGRILKGERPADLPVVQPTKFEFVINLTTARALGLTVPPSLLARADEVIE
jgi:putative tryptophan/tyrosine transport system substrate-binding protein